MAESRRAVANAPNDRRKDAEELATLYCDHADVFTRESELKARIKRHATDAGESFQEVFPGKGIIKASGDKPAKFKGTFPVIQEHAYFALTDKRREKLGEDGIIIMTPLWGNPSYGRVMFEPFRSAA
jgi:hypothetical protein